MKSVAVLCESSKNIEKAREISSSMDVPLFLGAPLGNFDFLLAVTDEHVELRSSDERLNPLFVDFAGGAVDYRRRYGAEGGQQVLKAVGGAGKKVLDATAGLATDSFILAALGCDVTAVEKSAAVAALVQDALERGRLNPSTLEICARIRLHVADAVDFLAQAIGRFDVVYLDPMFPEKKKKALPKKELQFLQDLVGTGDEDESRAIFAAAGKHAPRVVVKRPIRAPALVDGVSHSIKGKSIRFDVYIFS